MNRPCLEGEAGFEPATCNCRYIAALPEVLFARRCAPACKRGAYVVESGRAESNRPSVGRTYEVNRADDTQRLCPKEGKP